MLKDEQLANADGIIRSIQIIGFALIMGVLFAAVMLVATVGINNLHTNLDVLSIFTLVAGAITLLMSFVIPGIAWNAHAHKVRNQHDKKDVDGLIQSLAGGFQTKKIIQFALVEGGAFANILMLVVTKCAFHILSLIHI